MPNQPHQRLMPSILLASVYWGQRRRAMSAIFDVDIAFALRLILALARRVPLAPEELRSSGVKRQRYAAQGILRRMVAFLLTKSKAAPKLVRHDLPRASRRRRSSIINDCRQMPIAAMLRFDGGRGRHEITPLYCAFRIARRA